MRLKIVAFGRETHQYFKKQIVLLLEVVFLAVGEPDLQSPSKSHKRVLCCAVEICISHDMNWQKI